MFRSTFLWASHWKVLVVANSEAAEGPSLPTPYFIFQWYGMPVSLPKHPPSSSRGLAFIFRSPKTNYLESDMYLFPRRIALYV